MRLTQVLLVLFAVAAGPASPAELLAQKPRSLEPVYPGKEWNSKKPAEVAMDAGKLKAAAEVAGGRGCIVRHGYLVYSWGDIKRRGDVASACKPWYTHFLIVAVETGKVAGFDEKILCWEPRLKPLNAGFDYKDRHITWAHLANQTSCYGVREKPGTAYDYNDFNMALFFDTLFLKSYGSTWKSVDESVLHPLLTDVIGCQDNPTFMAFGPGNRPGRVGVSVRDFARFGLLYLRDGVWKGKRLIRSDSIRRVISSSLPNSIPRTKGKDADMIPSQRSVGGGKNQTDHMGSYSYAWWTNGVDRAGKRHWPDVPENAYGAFGHGGLRAMVVLPGQDVIVSWNDTRVNSRQLENRVLGLVVEACRAATPSH